MFLAKGSQIGRRTSDFRKRHAVPDSDLDQGGRSHKKQKLDHPAFPPPRFWDQLSVIPLTRRALQESQRRISQSSCGQKTRNCYACAPPHPTNPSRFVEQLSPTFLRRLQRSARQGGPDLRDIRGCRTPTETLDEMSSSHSSSRRRKRVSQSLLKRSSNSLSKSNATPITTTTKSTSPYDRAFQQHLIDHDVLPDGYEYPDGRLPPEPENMDEIRWTMAQKRNSLSPSRFTDDEFRKFKRADTHASKERDVTTTVIPLIEGHTGGRKCVAGQIPFTNLKHLTDGTLVSGNPDLYYGARPEQLDRTIRGELNKMIIPSTQHDLPIVPNFCLAVKGPDGSLSVASRQASYDGALGARAIHSLQSYGQVPRLDNNAYALTSIYHGGTLKTYTSHPIPSYALNMASGFVMTQIKSWALTGDADAFRQGATAYRNLRDWAKKQRDTAITMANESLFRNTGASPLQDAEGLASSFMSEASAADTIVASQTTVLCLDSNPQTSYGSDSSDDPLPLYMPPLDLMPPAKRAKSRSRSPREKT